MRKKKISIFSVILLIICAVLLTSSIFSPIWRIELSAPQYPEGLVLLLHSDKIAGDVDAINGLNHYIGMQTLHTENFIEFTVLPYILGAFALLFLISAFMRSRKMTLASFVLFVIFGIIAVLDFYRWNHSYGSNLDPTAAIKIPGMSYSPPVLGHKQLLNFGAYSIPDIGGWLILAAALLLAIIVVKEFHLFGILKKRRTAAFLLPWIAVAFLSCINDKPREVNLNEDECELCRMSITDPKFATQLITDKGRYLIFDDISCLVRYMKENEQVKPRKLYVADYLKEGHFIEVEKAFYIKGGEVHSPMAGNIAAFETQNEAETAAKQLNAEIVSWEDIDF